MLLACQAHFPSLHPPPCDMAGRPEECAAVSGRNLSLLTLGLYVIPLGEGAVRVGAAALAEALQIPQEQAALALGTLAAVLPAEDPALGDGAGDAAGADIRDVLLFLYIQSYKRLVPRSAHKDSPAVADVWPSTSAFDGYLSALSPIQVRINRAPFI